MATALRAGSQEIHVILVGWLVGWSKPPSESRVEGGHEALGASRAEGEDAGSNEGRDRWNLEFGQFVTRSWPCCMLHFKIYEKESSIKRHEFVKLSATIGAGGGFALCLA